MILRIFFTIFTLLLIPHNFCNGYRIQPREGSLSLPIKPSNTLSKIKATEAPTIIPAQPIPTIEPTNVGPTELLTVEPDRYVPPVIVPSPENFGKPVKPKEPEALMVDLEDEVPNESVEPSHTINSVSITQPPSSGVQQEELQNELKPTIEEPVEAVNLQSGPVLATYPLVPSKPNLKPTAVKPILKPSRKPVGATVQKPVTPLNSNQELNENVEIPPEISVPDKTDNVQPESNQKPNSITDNKPSEAGSLAKPNEVDEIEVVSRPLKPIKPHKPIILHKPKPSKPSLEIDNKPAVESVKPNQETVTGNNPASLESDSLKPNEVDELQVVSRPLTPIKPHKPLIQHKPESSTIEPQTEENKPDRPVKPTKPTSELSGELGQEPEVDNQIKPNKPHTVHKPTAKPSKPSKLEIENKPVIAHKPSKPLSVSVITPEKPAEGKPETVVEINHESNLQAENRPDNTVDAEKPVSAQKPEVNPESNSDNQPESVEPHKPDTDQEPISRPSEELDNTPEVGNKPEVPTGPNKPLEVQKPPSEPSQPDSNNESKPEVPLKPDEPKPQEPVPDILNKPVQQLEESSKPENPEKPEVQKPVSGSSTEADKDTKVEVKPESSVELNKPIVEQKPGPAISIELSLQPESQEVHPEEPTKPVSLVESNQQTSSEVETEPESLPKPNKPQKPAVEVSENQITPIKPEISTNEEKPISGVPVEPNQESDSGIKPDVLSESSKPIGEKPVSSEAQNQQVDAEEEHKPVKPDENFVVPEPEQTEKQPVSEVGSKPEKPNQSAHKPTEISEEPNGQPDLEEVKPVVHKPELSGEPPISDTEFKPEKPITIHKPTGSSEDPNENLEVVKPDVQNPVQELVGEKPDTDIESKPELNKPIVAHKPALEEANEQPHLEEDVKPAKPENPVAELFEEPNEKPSSETHSEPTKPHDIHKPISAQPELEQKPSSESESKPSVAQEPEVGLDESNQQSDLGEEKPNKPLSGQKPVSEHSGESHEPTLEVSSNPEASHKPDKPAHIPSGVSQLSLEEENKPVKPTKPQKPAVLVESSHPASETESKSDESEQTNGFFNQKPDNEPTQEVNQKPNAEEEVKPNKPLVVQIPVSGLLIKPEAGLEVESKPDIENPSIVQKPEVSEQVDQQSDLEEENKPVKPIIVQKPVTDFSESIPSNSLQSSSVESKPEAPDSESSEKPNKPHTEEEAKPVRPSKPLVGQNPVSELLEPNHQPSSEIDSRPEVAEKPTKPVLVHKPASESSEDLTQQEETKPVRPSKPSIQKPEVSAEVNQQTDTEFKPDETVKPNKPSLAHKPSLGSDEINFEAEAKPQAPVKPVKPIIAMKPVLDLIDLIDERKPDIPLTPKKPVIVMKPMSELINNQNDEVPIRQDKPVGQKPVPTKPILFRPHKPEVVEVLVKPDLEPTEESFQKPNEVSTKPEPVELNVALKPTSKPSIEPVDLVVQTILASQHRPNKPFVHKPTWKPSTDQQINIEAPAESNKPVVVKPTSEPTIPNQQIDVENKPVIPDVGGDTGTLIKPDASNVKPTESQEDVQSALDSNSELTAEHNKETNPSIDVQVIPNVPVPGDPTPEPTAEPNQQIDLVQEGKPEVLVEPSKPTTDEPVVESNHQGALSTKPDEFVASNKPGFDSIESIQSSNEVISTETDHLSKPEHSVEIPAEVLQINTQAESQPENSVSSNLSSNLNPTSESSVDSNQEVGSTPENELDTLVKPGNPNVFKPSTQDPVIESLHQPNVISSQSSSAESNKPLEPEIDSDDESLVKPNKPGVEKPTTESLEKPNVEPELTETNLETEVKPNEPELPIETLQELDEHISLQSPSIPSEEPDKPTELTDTNLETAANPTDPDVPVETIHQPDEHISSQTPSNSSEEPDKLIESEVGSESETLVKPNTPSVVKPTTESLDESNLETELAKPISLVPSQSSSPIAELHKPNKPSLVKPPTTESLGETNLKPEHVEPFNSDTPSKPDSLESINQANEPQSSNVMTGTIESEIDDSETFVKPNVVKPTETLGETDLQSENVEILDSGAPVNPESPLESNHQPNEPISSQSSPISEANEPIESDDSATLIRPNKPSIVKPTESAEESDIQPEHIESLNLEAPVKPSITVSVETNHQPDEHISSQSSSNPNEEPNKVIESEVKGSNKGSNSGTLLSLNEPSVVKPTIEHLEESNSEPEPLEPISEVKPENSHNPPELVPQSNEPTISSQSGVAEPNKPLESEGNSGLSSLIKPNKPSDLKPTTESLGETNLQPEPIEPLNLEAPVKPDSPLELVHQPNDPQPSSPVVEPNKPAQSEADGAETLAKPDSPSVAKPTVDSLGGTNEPESPSELIHQSEPTSSQDSSPIVESNKPIQPEADVSETLVKPDAPSVVKPTIESLGEKPESPSELIHQSEPISSQESSPIAESNKPIQSEADDSETLVKPDTASVVKPTVESLGEKPESPSEAIHQNEPISSQESTPIGESNKPIHSEVDSQNQVKPDTPNILKPTEESLVQSEPVEQVNLEVPVKQENSDNAQESVHRPNEPALSSQSSNPVADKPIQSEVDTDSGIFVNPNKPTVEKPITESLEGSNLEPELAKPSNLEDSAISNKPDTPLDSPTDFSLETNQLSDDVGPQKPGKPHRPIVVFKPIRPKPPKPSTVKPEYPSSTQAGSFL